MNKGFALQVAESLLISIDAGGRGWVADQTEVVQNGRSRWLPTLIFGRVIVTIENGVSTVKHSDHLQAHPFGDLREAVVFAEAWAAVPKRIQRKRTAGWKMPANTVYVGRPSKWGNDYHVGYPDPITREPMTAVDVVRWFQTYCDQANEEGERIRAQIRQELAGKDLACWCKVGEPCHADVLLQIANEE